MLLPIAWLITTATSLHYRLMRGRQTGLLVKPKDLVTAMTVAQCTCKDALQDLAESLQLIRLSVNLAAVKNLCD